MKLKRLMLPSVIGVSFVAILSFLFLINPAVTRSVMNLVENWAYDLEVKNYYRPLETDSPICIVDINDASLDQIGRWPWPRNILAQIVETSANFGAKALIFNIVFSSPEQNIIDEVEEGIPSSQQGDQALQYLRSIRGLFDRDLQFSESIQKIPTVLGMALFPQGASQGVLPPPLQVLGELPSEIPNNGSFLGNIKILQGAAAQAGFINSAPDADGVLRSSPLLLKENEKVYGALGLCAAAVYHDIQHIEMQPDGFLLGSTFVPTDKRGCLLIPFRGPPHSFSYISAVDLLHGKVLREQLEGKIVFIGSTATALGVLAPTAIAPLFPGIEIQATITASLLDRYLPYKPHWGRSWTFAAICVLGILCSFWFPRLMPLSLTAVSVFIPIILLIIHQLLWFHYLIVVDIFFPIMTVAILFIFNLIYGYFTEDEQRKELKLIFEHYVPPEYIDVMLERGESANLDGETKEMTVLFADIVGFTHMAESMSAQKIKGLLNEYLSPMTEVIFRHHGTIDKYVGDMIIAFWGAPLDNPQHASAAVESAVEMQKQLDVVNLGFKKGGQPAIHIGIGVNTGSMNVGDMGSKFRRAYTVISDSVNTGARLESLTRLYKVGIIVGEETQRKTKDQFLYLKLDKVKVKGKDRAIDIFEPICSLQQASTQLSTAVQLHEQTLQKLWQRDWDGAERQFAQLHSMAMPNFPNYQVYLDRIADLRTHNPPDQWMGEVVLDTK